jgi:hypothetical protein
MTTVVSLPIWESSIENSINFQFFNLTHLFLFVFLTKKIEFFFHFDNTINYPSSIIFLGPSLFEFFVGISIFLLQICWFRVHGTYLGFKIGCSRTLLLRSILGTISWWRSLQYSVCIEDILLLFYLGVTKNTIQRMEENICRKILLPIYFLKFQVCVK